MPRVSETFPSKNLSAADLGEADFLGTITDVEEQAFDDGTKLVVHFRETGKTLVCNKTNARTVATLYGDDTDDWVGKQVTLYPTWVDFGGKQVEAIRVRPKAPKAASRRTAKPMTQAEVDDQGQQDIPF